MTLPEKWWRDADLLRTQVEEHGGFVPCSRAHGGKPSDYALRRSWTKHGFAPFRSPYLNRGGNVGPARTTETHAAIPGRADDQWLLDVLKRLGDDSTIDQLADAADVAPRRVREAMHRLRDSGYRLAEEDEQVVLTRVPPERDNLHSLSPALFDGEKFRVGVVSDTHLGANEEALEELHLAYDVFAREGIAEVWHAGDWGTGVGMFRTHHAESKVHSAEAHTAYLVEHYPRRDGIVTRGISGNHDLEGDLGRVGFDAARAFANQRDDIEYLGEYSAWLELREGTGSYVHLLHGAGGMSYSYSYKAQKLVDGYPSGRKPAALIVGHWHVRGNIRARDVEVLWPGCFEWQSRFLKRLGLHPAVGFHILEATIADDGSIVRWRPEWFPYFAGRMVKAA